jgi:hypothetical protein
LITDDENWEEMLEHGRKVFSHHKGGSVGVLKAALSLAKKGPGLCNKDAVTGFELDVCSRLDFIARERLFDKLPVDVALTRDAIRLELIQQDAASIEASMMASIKLKQVTGLQLSDRNLRWKRPEQQANDIIGKILRGSSNEPRIVTKERYDYIVRDAGIKLPASKLTMLLVKDIRVRPLDMVKDGHMRVDQDTINHAVYGSCLQKLSKDEIDRRVVDGSIMGMTWTSVTDLSPRTYARGIRGEIDPRSLFSELVILGITEEPALDIALRASGVPPEVRDRIRSAIEYGSYDRTGFGFHTLLSPMATFEYVPGESHRVPFSLIVNEGESAIVSARRGAGALVRLDIDGAGGCL